MATATFNQPVPFATRRYLPEVRTVLPTGITHNRLQDPEYGSPFVGTVWDTAGPFPGDGVAGVDYNLVATITPSSTPNPSTAYANALTASRSVHHPVIEVQPAVTLTGPFTNPVNNFGEILEVRTTAWASLSSRTLHFDQANDTALCFTMRNQNIANGIAFSSANQATPIRFRGMKAQLNTGAGKQTATWCYLGPSTMTTLANRATEIIFEKCCCDVDPTSTDARRWATIQAVVKVALIGCDFLGWHSSVASDSQAIYLNHGISKFKGINIRVQAGGEPWFYGGGSPLPGDDPAWVNEDIEFRGLISSSYPEDGSSSASNAKNVGEGKSGRRVLVTDFVLRHLVEKGQDKALALKNVWDGTQGGAHNESTDITLWFGRMVDVPGVLAVIGKETFTGTWPLSPLTNVEGRFILADRLDIAPYSFLPAGGRHLMIIGNNPVNVTMDHWTLACGPGDAPRATGLLALSVNAGAGSYSCDGLRITNSVFPQLTYGVLASSLAEGNAALTTANNVVWRKNLLYRRVGGSTATTYPATTQFVSSQAGAMPSFASGDYNVAGPYQGTADDGLDYGAIPNWVLARIPSVSGGIVYGALSKPLPLGFSATASAQVTAAFSKALPLRAGFSSTGSVQVDGALSKPLPLALSAAGTVGTTIAAAFDQALPLLLAASVAVQVTGAFDQPLPLSLSAATSVQATAALDRAVPFALTTEASVQVDGALDKALPFGFSATGSSAVANVVATFDQVLPLTLSAAVSVQVSAELFQALPLTLTGTISPVATADFDQVLPLRGVATGTTLGVETDLLLFTDASQIHLRFTDKSGSSVRLMDASLLLGGGVSRFGFTDVSRIFWRFMDSSDPPV